MRWTRNKLLAVYSGVSTQYGIRMEIIFLVFVMAGIGLFIGHIKTYKSVLHALEKKGLNSNEYQLSIINYGSAGCLAKINLLLISEDVELTKEERTLLVKSKYLYFLQLPVIILFIITILIGV